MSNKDRNHAKCRKLGTSGICVCCPCGCDTPMDAPNYAELHGAPTEQKEEWEEEFDILSDTQIFTIDGKKGTLKNIYIYESLISFIRIQIALAEERGRREVITEDTSDGFHTFKELYEFRKMFNAALFNEWAKQGKYSVHKSIRHGDGELAFGGGWFIVMATLPTGQISNHYEMKDYDLFECEEREKADAWDGHTANDVLQRLSTITQKS